LQVASQISSIAIAIVAVLTSLAAIFYFSVNAVIAQNVVPRLDRLEDGQAAVIQRLEKIEQAQQSILEKI
ncbi:MAG: hypothetical protein AAF329_23555, partial [Cyanobacteria bacterium P01_A01_bin.17]